MVHIFMSFSVMSKKTKYRKNGNTGKKGKKLKKRESEKALSVANSKVWEARLVVTERSRQEYRESSRRLLDGNDALHTCMLNNEQDTIDLIKYLKIQDCEKDSRLKQYQNEIRDMRKEHCREKEFIVEQFGRRVGEHEEKMCMKERELELMQNELKAVNEFRRKREQIQKEVADIKRSLHVANQNHTVEVARMERKFFEEKIRLQQEADQRMSELADKAHSEAIDNLDVTTKSVYRENVRLTESLSFHMKEDDLLRTERDRLKEIVLSMTGDKTVKDVIVEEKVSEAGRHKRHILKLQDKVSTLEMSLTHVVREFGTEQSLSAEKAQLENRSALVEVSKLQRVLEIKTKELSKIKRLAKNILDQRSEVETFFLDALEHVRLEITDNQAHYRKDAQAAYQRKMLEAHGGKTDFPKIRTFNVSGNSTNSVFKDIEAAERLYGVTGKLDVRDLTWEQKERVLRFLFAKMNRSGRRSSLTTLNRKQPALPPITDHTGWVRLKRDENTNDVSVFLTQAHVEGGFPVSTEMM